MLTIDQLYSERLCRFRDFLAKRCGFDASDLPVPGQQAHSGNSIGSLAMQNGLLDLDQVNRIRESQSSFEPRKLFGETAVALQYLTTREVDRILEMQEYHEQLSYGQQLVAHGDLEFGPLLMLINEFREMMAEMSLIEEYSGSRS